MASLKSDDLQYVILGADSHYYWKPWELFVGNSYDGEDHWLPSQSEWTDLGGSFISEPVVCPWGNDMFVFGLDITSSLKYRRFNGTTKVWETSSWCSLGTPAEKWLNKPGTAAAYPNWLELIIIGHDRCLYQFWYKEGSTWSQSSGFSANALFKEPPVLTTFGADRFDIFCVSEDGKLYHKWWIDRQGWFPQGGKYEELGGPFFKQVQAISKQVGHIDLMVVGYDGKLYHRAYNSSWLGWDTLTGTYKGIPELVSFKSDRIDAFVLQPSGMVAHLTNTSSKGWSSPTVVAGPSVLDRVTATSWGPGRIDLAVTRAGSTIGHKSYTESRGGWTPVGDATEDLSGVAISRVGTHS